MDFDNDDYGGAEENPSLSQLIYHSQPLSQPSPSKKRRRGPDEARKDEQDLVDEFYGLKEELNVRKRRRSKPAKREMGERNDRSEAAKLRGKLISRWKRRRINMTGETDEGGAFEALARKQMEQRKKSHKETENTKEDSFWDLGFTAPPTGTIVPEPKQVKIEPRKLPPEDKTPYAKYPLRLDRRIARDVRSETKEFFPIQNATNCPISGVHFHQGTLACMTTQSLVTSCQQDEEEQDRLLSNLFRLKSNCRSDAIIGLTREQAVNVQFLQEHSWKDRAEAARMLGILPTETTKMNLESTQRDIMYQSGDRQRKRTVHKLRGKKVKSSLPQDNDNLPDPGSTDFDHAPGCVPPVPHHALDETNVMFGSEDPFRHVIDTAQIESSTSDLVMTTLLSRLFKADNNTTQHFIHERIVNFLQLIRSTNRVGTKYIRNRYKIGEDVPDYAIPVVSEYQTLMKYCTYVGNLSVAPVSDTPNTSASKLDKTLATSELLPSNLQRVADDLCHELNDQLKRPGVAAFPRLHFIYSLCVIARALPNEAAKAIATGWERPFDIVRSLLKFLESERLLTDLSESAPPFLSVAHLEHVLHKAAESIEKRCVPCSQSDVDYRAWVAALRLGCLVLSSGLEIECGAHLYPSFKIKVETTESYFSQDSQQNNLDHEVRVCLPKFEEIRRTAAQSTLTFIQSAQQTRGGGDYLIINALGWHQAMALLVGPGQKQNCVKHTESCWQEVKSLYMANILQALHRPQYSQLLALKNKALIDQNKFLDILASNLESDPSTVHNWRLLTLEIGLLGCQLSVAQREVCEKCPECACLLHGLSVDHTMKGRESWWGKGRLSWWGSHLLKFPLAPIPSSNSVSHVLKIIEKRLDHDLPSFELTPPLVKESMSSEVMEPAGLGWLEKLLNFPEEDLKRKEPGTMAPTPNLERRSYQVPSECLPPSPAELELNDFDSTGSGVVVSNESLEMICYKIFLAAHLYGPNHESVVAGLLHLTHLYDSDEKENAWESLRWLTAKGLHISHVLALSMSRNPTGSQ